MHVSQITSRNPNPLPSRAKPAHWVDTLGTSFQNPWESYVPLSFTNWLSVGQIFPLLLEDIHHLQMTCYSL